VLFEQVIFLQDRIHSRKPAAAAAALEPRLEIPTRADSSSIAYRRWIKEKGLLFGTAQRDSEAPKREIHRPERTRDLITGLIDSHNAQDRPIADGGGNGF